MTQRSKEQLTDQKVRIGTSGWSYKEWEDVFYPDSKTPKLGYYSSVFNTAEIDSTFYANPPRGLVLGWVKNTPRDFEFSVKLPQVITHEKELDLSLGAEVELQNFLDLLNPLHEAGKLGPLLIQLPPSFAASKRKALEQFLDSLLADRKFAIEFRNKSWLKESDLNELLKKYNVANTIVDEPLLPVDLSTTADFGFVRWHGRGRRPWYNYRYSQEELDPWVERIKTVSSKVKKVYGYYNNHFRGYAIENSLEFMGKVGISNYLRRQKLDDVLKRIEGSGDEEEQTGQRPATSRSLRQRKEVTNPPDRKQKSLTDF